MSNADPPLALQTTPPGLVDFPALAELGLTDEELEALRSQGFVGQETRHHRLYYKLRFRLHGKQRVRYIRGAARAQAVRSELDALQHMVLHAREIAALAREGAAILRASKKSLAPLLAARNFHFHGRSIRRRRRPKTLAP
jgi:hypothetical protein